MGCFTYDGLIGILSKYSVNKHFHFILFVVLEAQRIPSELFRRRHTLSLFNLQYVLALAISHPLNYISRYMTFWWRKLSAIITAILLNLNIYKQPEKNPIFTLTLHTHKHAMRLFFWVTVENNNNNSRTDNNPPDLKMIYLLSCNNLFINQSSFFSFCLSPCNMFMMCAAAPFC